MRTDVKVKFCMHDIASNTHNPNWLEAETAQVKDSAIDSVESRLICILKDFDFEISSNYFNLIEEAFQARSATVVYTDFSTSS